MKHPKYMNCTIGEPLTALMDNVLAHRLAGICVKVANQRNGVGDSIDRGLILLHRLEAEGFNLVPNNNLK